MKHEWRAPRRALRSDRIQNELLRRGAGVLGREILYLRSDIRRGSKIGDETLECSTDVFIYTHTINSERGHLYF